MNIPRQSKARPHILLKNKQEGIGGKKEKEKGREEGKCRETGKQKGQDRSG